MDGMEDKAMLQKSGATLQRPVQMVKKRSGPLDDALNELHREIGDGKQSTPASPTVASASTPWQVTPTDAAVKVREFSITVASPQPARRRPTIKEKEKKRERWLLTRKTWKYMTDAGRKLIPDAAQNRSEDISKIEAHFQQVCANEPRFVLWRRKSSYPGATRNSKRRLKQLLQHTGQKGPLTMETLEQEEANNVDQIIDLLQSYLKHDEACKTTTLLSSKTVRPDQTISPSARRPGRSGKLLTNSSNLTYRGSNFFTPQLPKTLQQLNEIDQLLERLRVLSRNVSNNVFPIPLEHITPAILQDKALLKQVYNSLKKQQLHRILCKHYSPILKDSRSKLNPSSSLTNLLHFGSGSGDTVKRTDGEIDHCSHTGAPIKDQVSLAAYTVEPLIPKIIATTGTTPMVNTSTNAGCDALSPTPMLRQRKPPTTLDVPSLCSGGKNNASLRRFKQQPIERYFNTCGTQTNFIPLQEVKRLAEEYKERKREEAALYGSSFGTPGATDDETEKGGSTIPARNQHHRRKSSIDNVDVSQSVSDTIKRYLRMARKKSVHDDNANRFKRVNYDRNLRNIKAKGEINPPGMDEDNSKAVQTLDAWSVLSLDFIRGNEYSGALEAAHVEWQRALDERIQKKLEYAQKLSGQIGACDVNDGTSISRDKKSIVSKCNSSSAPNSPTANENCASIEAVNSLGSGVGGFRLAGSQFLSNLWHATNTTNEDSSRSRNIGSSSSHSRRTNSFLKLHRKGKSDQSIGRGDSATQKSSLIAAMQKSKSSSNVGQFVSRKLLKSRSKSQSRSNTQLSKWAPAENFIWTSDNGDRIFIRDSFIQNLTDIEANILQRVAKEKISELNIGVNLPLDHDDKPQKRRAVSKRRALTTSFFDLSRKEEQSNSIFGNTLESCLINDRKRESLLKASLERGSRNSIASLFRGGTASEFPFKLFDNLRSHESLPSSTFYVATPRIEVVSPDSGHVGSVKSRSGYFGNPSKSKSMQKHISRSQFDLRRRSQELDLEGFKLQDSTNFKELHETISKPLQVPQFVMLCIKYLEENGLHEVGLFRVSTSKKRVKQMRHNFHKISAIHFGAETSPHDVATLLKEFLRDLPQPLLCSGLYKAFLETQRIRNRRLQLEAISHLVKLLPVTHRDTLYVLLKFLAKVASCSDDTTNREGTLQISGNKMDSNNLATVFAPNILRTTLNTSSNAAAAEAAYSNIQEQKSMSDAINVVRIMIDHYEEVFKVPAELIDIVYSHMLDMCPEKLYFLCEQRSQSVRFRYDIGNSYYSLCTPQQMTSPMFSTTAESTSSSNIANTSKAALKRFFTRESVTHDNDASRAPDTAKNSSHDVKRYSNTHSSRHSSPNKLDKPGVVSATLQIPVPVVAHASPMKLDAGSLQEKLPLVLSNEKSLSNLDEVYRGTVQPGAPNTTTATITDGYECTDIPYVEDATAGQELKMSNQYFPISGSLSLSPKGHGSANDYRQVQVLQQKPQQQQQHKQYRDDRSSRLRMSSTSLISSSKSLPIFSFEADAPSAMVGDVLQKPGNNEPKLPTSISNIGGAILRSKTADFERMTLKTEQHQPAEATRSARAMSASHLYKRQELMQSTKRGNASK